MEKSQKGRTAFYCAIMNYGGDDLEDNFLLDHDLVALSGDEVEDDESVSEEQTPEQEDQSKAQAAQEQKKRKRKEKDRERKAKVSPFQCIFSYDLKFLICVLHDV